MDKTYLFASLNLLLCGGIMFVSVCRLGAMTRKTLRRVQWEYAALNVAAFASAFSPWYGEWPGYAQIGLAVAVLTSLLASGYVWQDRSGDRPPPQTERDDARCPEGLT